MKQEVNTQLFENSPLKEMFEGVEERGTDFFNAKDPNLAIMHERPEHRSILWAKARGHSNREIAGLTGYTEPWISQILRQPWARRYLADEIDRAGKDQLTGLIESAAKDSIWKLIELRDDPEAPKNVVANVSEYLVDRYLGKPKQSVEQRVGSLESLSNAELETIARGASTTTTS
jgi:hypothetical protein